MAQHWVPQHVLRGFSNDGLRICPYDKTGKIAAMMVGIKGACGRNDAFSEEVERLLTTIENAANPVIDMFRRMEHAMRVDPVVKRIVAVYLTAFLWRRSPAIRDLQAAETTEEDLLAWCREATERYGRPRSLNQDRLPAIAASLASDVNGLMARYWGANVFGRWLLYSMSWAVLRCAEPNVTIPDCGMFRLGGIGLLDPRAEIYFPLSATRVLVASWRGAPPSEVQLLTASPAHVREINKLGFKQAGRFVYGQKRSKKVAMAVLRPSHRSTRLKGLNVTGGTNPTVNKLDDLNDWCSKMIDEGSYHPDHHLCIAPGAGEQFRHSWQRVSVGLPVAREAPEIKMPDRICEWCGARERRYLNGQVEFNDLELKRRRTKEPQPNWWQAFRIEATDTAIRAVGATPRYL